MANTVRGRSRKDSVRAVGRDSRAFQPDFVGLPFAIDREIAPPLVEKRTGEPLHFLRSRIIFIAPLAGRFVAWQKESVLAGFQDYRPEEKRRNAGRSVAQDAILAEARTLLGRRPSGQPHTEHDHERQPQQTAGEFHGEALRTIEAETPPPRKVGAPGCAPGLVLNHNAN